MKDDCRGTPSNRPRRGGRHKVCNDEPTIPAYCEAPFGLITELLDRRAYEIIRSVPTLDKLVTLGRLRDEPTSR